MSREWRLYWRDVIECCRKIERYAAGMDLDAFKADERTYDAVVRNVELIGEAVKALPEDARALAPQIEWRRIAGMRDFVAHVYFGINDMILLGCRDEQGAGIARCHGAHRHHFYVRSKWPMIRPQLGHPEAPRLFAGMEQTIFRDHAPGGLRASAHGALSARRGLSPCSIALTRQARFAHEGDLQIDARERATHAMRAHLVVQALEERDGVLGHAHAHLGEAGARRTLLGVLDE